MQTYNPRHVPALHTECNIWPNLIYVSVWIMFSDGFGLRHSCYAFDKFIGKYTP